METVTFLKSVDELGNEAFWDLDEREIASHLGSVSDVEVPVLSLEGIIVLVDEEYGYREWVWQPMCDVDELMQRWEKRTKVFPTQDELGGKWYGSEIRAGGYLLWDASTLIGFLPSSEEHGKCHLHIEDDSYLKVHLTPR